MVGLLAMARQMSPALLRLSAMGAALLSNLEWGVIGVLVFGLCGTAIAVVGLLVKPPVPTRFSGAVGQVGWARISVTKLRTRSASR